MRFEDLSNDYLSDLITQGVILDGQLHGVNENLQTSNGVATFLINGEAKVKKIFIHKINDIMSWKFLTPVDNVDIQYEEGDWNYPSFAKRIVAPISLIMEDVGIKMYGWFQLNELPVISKNNVVYLYCNVILSEHQAVIDQLDGLITIEDNPN